MSETRNPHFDCLQTVSIVLNRHQDICDVLDDKKLTDSEKLERIRELNGKIGTVVAEYLPG